jgi:hypothetical protein
MSIKRNYGRIPVRPRLSESTRNDALLVLSFITFVVCLSIIAIYFPE